MLTCEWTRHLCIVFGTTHADIVNDVRIAGRRWEMRENRLWTHLKKGARGPDRIINCSMSERGGAPESDKVFQCVLVADSACLSATVTVFFRADYTFAWTSCSTEFGRKVYSQHHHPNPEPGQQGLSHYFRYHRAASQARISPTRK
jgi:hypothetical protein